MPARTGPKSRTRLHGRASARAPGSTAHSSSSSEVIPPARSARYQDEMQALRECYTRVMDPAARIESALPLEVMQSVQGANCESGHCCSAVRLTCEVDAAPKRAPCWCQRNRPASCETAARSRANDAIRLSTALAACEVGGLSEEPEDHETTEPNRDNLLKAAAPRDNRGREA
jgi:hypothetical protein